MSLSNEPPALYHYGPGGCVQWVPSSRGKGAFRLDRSGAKADPSSRALQGRGGAYYDCIIPVNGDGDSFFVVDQLKNKYGMNPLLITYNIHYNTKLGIRNLARLITKLDCDHVMFTVSPTTLKKVVRRTLEKIGDMYWHVAAGVQPLPSPSPNASTFP